MGIIELKNNRILGLLITLFFVHLFVFSQNNNHKKHIVQKGETIYSISKKYNVSKDDLIKWNGGLPEGLKADSEIWITAPDTEEKNENSNISKSKPQTAIIEPHKNLAGKHIVEKGETVYSISKKYNLSEKDLSDFNPKLSKGLKAGDTLLIKPEKSAGTIKQSVSEIQVKESILITKPKEEDVIRVNLVLPFHLKKNNFQEEDEENTDQLVKKNLGIFGKSYNALEFYTGFKFACDSLSKLGKKIYLQVLDAPMDSLEYLKFIKESKLYDTEIIAGPFNSSQSALLAAECQKKKVWYISPFGQQNKMLLGNKYAFKVSPSITTQSEKIAKYISLKYKQKPNVICIHNNLSKEKISVSAFKKYFQKLSGDSAKEIIYKSAGLVGLKSKLSISKENILVVCSSDQAFVTDFFNKAEAVFKDYKTTTFGMQAWLEYDNIDAKVYEKANVIIPSDEYIDWKDSSKFSCYQQFRNTYNTDFGKYSAKGFDIAMFVLGNIDANNVSNTDEKLKNKIYKGVSGNILFEQTSPESGYENSEIFYFRFEDYSLIKMDEE